MQVTKGTWRMREQCVPGSLSSSHAREPGNEAKLMGSLEMNPVPCLFYFHSIPQMFNLCFHISITNSIPFHVLVAIP